MAAYFSESDTETPKSICTSILKRCVQTGRILAKILDIEVLSSKENLEEVYRGDWRNLSDDDKVKAATALWVKEYEEYELLVQDCEKWDDFNKRVDDAMYSLLTSIESCCIFVTHGQFIKTFLKQRDCWDNDWGEEWSGSDRPPIELTIRDGHFYASIMEK